MKCPNCECEMERVRDRYVCAQCDYGEQAEQRDKPKAKKEKAKG